MASPLQFCTQADLERALGGAAVLVELLDKTGTGVADPDAVSDILDLGSNEVASYIQLEIDLGGLVSPYPRILVLKTADVCAFYAYSRGSYRQAVPPNVQSIYDNAIRWAQDVGQRRAGLGVVPQSAISAPAELIDPQLGTIPAGFSGGSDDWEMNSQPNGGAVSVAGFRRSGFR